MPNTITLTNAWATLTSGDYTVFNNDWGIPGGAPDASTSIAVSDPNDVNHNITFNWSVPNYIPSTYVWAYPEVYWGSQYNGTAAFASTTLGNLKDLNVTYSVSASSPDSDVLLEVWTKNASGALTNEISVFVYGWGNGETIPYRDQYITALENAHAPGAGGGSASWNFISLRTTTDQLSGTISFSNIISDLIQKGVVNPNDTVSGVELGSEMRQGSGSLQVNNFVVWEALKQTKSAIIENAGPNQQIFDISTNNDYVINGDGQSLVRFEFARSQYAITPTSSGLSVVDNNTNATVALNGISLSQVQFLDTTPPGDPPIGAPSPSSTPAPSPPPPNGDSASSTTQGTLGATASFSVTNDWGSGFLGNIAVAGGTTGLHGWTVDFDSAFNITNIWGADIFSHSGNHYEIKNASYDAFVAAGSSVSVGFQATSGASGDGVINLQLNGVGAENSATFTPVTLTLENGAASASSPIFTNNADLVGSAQANAVVTLQEANAVLGTATANSNGAWHFAPTGLSDGSHTIVASESVPGAPASTAELGFILDRIKPAVTISSQDFAGAIPPTLTTPPTLSGGGDSNAVVTLTDGVTSVGTTTSDALGHWTYTPAGLADGIHNLTASETDQAGNIGTASLSFTLDTHPQTGSNNAPGSSDATASYSVMNDWGSGFIGSIALGAGPNGLHGWTVDFDSAFDITNIWGADIVSHTGNHYELQSLSWDSGITAGGVATVGFQAIPGASGNSVSNLFVGS